MLCVSAIIPAAGSGTRMNALIPKALIPVHGRPLIEYSIELFLAIDAIQEIVIATPTDDKAFRYLEDAFEKVKLVTGGATRSDSVTNAVAQVREDSDYILVHDAARCFLSHEVVVRCLEAVGVHRAVTAAIPLVDTITRVKNGIIEDSLSRDGVWRVQTPQVFERTLLQQAHGAKSQSDSSQATDDASLVQSFCPVHVVMGDPKNIKVTTSADLV